MNALQLHDKLNEAIAKQHGLRVEADDRAETLKRECTPPSPYPSEWVQEHEEDAITKLRVEVTELSFSIAGMTAVLKAIRVKEDPERRL